MLRLRNPDARRMAHQTSRQAADKIRGARDVYRAVSVSAGPTGGGFGGVGGPSGSDDFEMGNGSGSGMGTASTLGTASESGDETSLGIFGAPIVERALEAAREIPDAVLKMNDWVRSIINCDPSHVETAMDSIALFRKYVDKWTETPGASESEIAYCTAMKQQLSDAMDIASHWVPLLQVINRKNLGWPVSATGVVSRAMCPEAAAMEEFLVLADARKWYVHEGKVFEDNGGYVTYKGDLESMMLSACRNTHIRKYLQDRPAVLAKVLKTLASGVMDRLPCVLFDTTAVAYPDRVLRLTDSGLKFEAMKELVRTARPVVAPRTFVSAAGPDADTSLYNLAVFQQWFPLFNEAQVRFVARLMGSVFRPRCLLQWDWWKYIVVAYGMADVDSHPVVVMCRTFLGQSIVCSLSNLVTPNTTRATDPYCLLVRAPEGNLTPENTTAIQYAMAHDMVVVVAAPRIPSQMYDDPVLRVASVGIEARSPPEPDLPLVSVLQTALAEYNLVPDQHRKALSPMFDRGGIACRLNSLVPLTALDLFKEMLQAAVFVKISPGKTAGWRVVQHVFNAYQVARGCKGFAQKVLNVQDVVTAAAFVSTKFSERQTVGKVDFLQSSAEFRNLEVLPVPADLAEFFPPGVDL